MRWAWKHWVFKMRIDPRTLSYWKGISNYFLCLTLMIGFGLIFQLDRNNSGKPRRPVTAQGRVIAHNIRPSGIVYLTEAEYHWYLIVYYGIGGCGTVFLLSNVVIYTLKKLAK